MNERELTIRLNFAGYFLLAGQQRQMIEKVDIHAENAALQVRWSTFALTKQLKPYIFPILEQYNAE